MAYKVIRTGHGTTGVKTATVGFQPVGARITLCAKSNSSSVNQLSSGVTDGTTSSFVSNYSDATSSQSKDNNTKIISHYERVSGTLTEKVAISFDSFTATEFKYNVTTADINYTLQIEVWD